MTSPKTNKLMIAHGPKPHKFGAPCKVCEGIFIDNPYVKRLIAKAEARVDKGWIDYFQHKDDMRKAGRKMAEEYLKNRAKPKRK